MEVFWNHINWKGKDWSFSSTGETRCKQKVTPQEHIEFFNAIISAGLKK